MRTEAGRSALRLKLAVKGVLGLGAIGGTLFAIAGRIDWRAAWVFLSLFAVYLFLGAWWFSRRDPELLEERMTTASNVPEWDRRLVRGYWVLLPMLFATAALDAGRFRWSDMSITVQALGAVSIIAAFLVIWWCTASNHFLSAHARIQSERGQRVVRQGPYRFVRHPMYASLIVLMFGMALTLGSWLAIVPAALIALLWWCGRPSKIACSPRNSPAIASTRMTFRNDCFQVCGDDRESLHLRHGLLEDPPDSEIRSPANGCSRVPKYESPSPYWRARSR
jgi:protein-S-isoprenylcysteine O-methyltransferase Ste14